NRKGKLSQTKQRQFGIYFNLWLATLAVLLEGFQENLIRSALKPWEENNSDIKVHVSVINGNVPWLREKLQRYRNAVVHFHATTKKHEEFLKVEGYFKPLEWAEDLQHEFYMLY